MSSFCTSIVPKLIAADSGALRIFLPLSYPPIVLSQFLFLFFVPFSLFLFRFHCFCSLSPVSYSLFLNCSLACLGSIQTFRANYTELVNLCRQNFVRLAWPYSFWDECMKRNTATECNKACRPAKINIFCYHYCIDYQSIPVTIIKFFSVAPETHGTFYFFRYQKL